MLKKTFVLSSLTVLAVTLASCAEGGFTGGSGTKKPGSGSGSGSPGGGAAAKQDGALTEKFDMNASLKVADIVIGIDTSGSMMGELNFLENNMQKFMDGLTDMNVDAQVTAIGSTKFNFPTSIPSNKFQVVNKKISSHDAIKVLTGFFQDGPHPLPFRNGANIEVIIVSDDDGTPKGGMAEDFQSVSGHTTYVNAIVGLGGGLDPTAAGCEVENPGSQHIKLADSTGGAKYSICEQDWNDMLKKLSKNIVERTTNVKLSKKPDLGKLAEVKVNGVTVDPSQYTISADGAVSFNTSYTGPKTGEVTVIYVPAS
jgi:hypothetical protein